MAEKTGIIAEQGEPTIVMTRVFDAPRELVWKAWTDPEQAKRWWGPKGYTCSHCEIDRRVGGKYLYCERGPDGQDYWSTGVYREIVPLERIVCTNSFADENGNVVPASHYGITADLPLEMLATVTFEELDGKTKLTLKHSIPASIAEQVGAREGWSEAFDKLAEVLARA